jgi:hypothetical protein
MDSGGSPGPSSNTTVTSNIPEYAKPYVTNMLEATQRQIFKGTPTAEGGFNITGFEGYKPYSADPRNYFAGFSPLQQQAQYDAGMMEQPGQFALGSGLTGSAGIRSLNAGNQYAQNVTSPASMQAYMSPYQQAVTDVATQGAIRDYQMQQNSQNLNAPRTGTYGGARQTLAQTENLRNLNSNLANIRTQGAQSAYDRAIQSQQFGANLGMQGLGQAMGAGAQLGQLGGAQQAADIARQNQMSQMGQQQQGLEQSKINQAIQDYATQQQYPQMQLGFMSNMLRGLPMQAQTTQGYQAQPSVLSQIGGLGLSGLGIYGMSGGFRGAKEGGLMAAKSYKKGGLAYADGGDISMMSDEELREMLKNPSLDPMLRAEIEKLLMLHQRMKMNPQTQQIMAPALERSGVSSIPTGDMVPEQMAGGGIVAFSNRGVVNLKDPTLSDSTAERRKMLQARESALFKRLFEDQDPFKESKSSEEEIRKSLAENKETNLFAALANAGFKMAQGSNDPSKRGNFLSELGEAGEAGLNTFARGKASEAEMKRALLGQVEKREASKFGRDVALQNALTTSLGQMDAKELGMLNARSNQALAASTKDSNLRLKYATLYKDTLDDVKDKMLKQDPFNQLYRKDPAGFNRAAEMEAKRMLPKEALEILGKTAAVDETPVAKPVAPGGKKPTPVVVTIPAKDGKPAQQVQFDSKEQADQFKKAAGIK